MIQHLAFIMDGNRRWAKRQGLSPFFGHNKGVEAIQHVIEFCINKNIKYTSLYAFSLENFKRSTPEVSHLFELLIKEASNRLNLFLEHNVRVRFIGNRELFPAKVKNAIALLEEKTAEQTTLNLNILFCYGARQEIINGIKNIIEHLKEGTLALDDINEEGFKHYLWTKNVPEPELIIRTGGCKRLSNFLLYQAAYSELCFLDCLWPDITQQDMQQALDDYLLTQRNFGQ